MRNNDTMNREALRAPLQEAIQAGDAAAFVQKFDEMLDVIAQDILEEYEQELSGLRQEMDGRILTARGVRQLTSEETTYYQKLIAAMKDRDPKQALTNLDVVMPETVIDSIFDDLRTNHPLLSRINFIPSGASVRMMMNTNGYQEAAWGPLCGEIVEELTSGFKEVSTTLSKLSAFMPICKAMLDLGPRWLDRYIREVLYEALANGMESGIATGDGKDKPIGMNRQVGSGVSVTDGVYPEKDKIAVTAFDATTIGTLVGQLAVDENGRSRPVRDLILLVNPKDYYTKIMPATTLMAPDGTYRNDVMPYPMSILQVAAIPEGAAIFGVSSRYFAAAGAERGGRIEYSDHYRFLEDERVYIIKTYATGMPKDNNSFLYLDISGLTPAIWKVQLVDAGSGASAVDAGDEAAD